MTNEIPSYLGLGILNSTDKSPKNNETIATYTLFEEIVTKLKVSSDGKALIEDYHQGELLGITSNIDVSHVIPMHFNNWSPESDPRYILLQKKVCSLGNIYFENPASSDKNQAVMSFSPAGRLLIFRIPIPLNPLSIRQKFADLAPNPDFDNKPYFSYNDNYFSTLFINGRNGDKDYEKICIFEVTVPLAYVFDAAKWFVDRGLVMPEARYRMIIQDIYHKTDEKIQGFICRPEDELKNYALHFKGDKQSKEDFYNIDEQLTK